jgi:hypothetical protein
MKEVVEQVVRGNVKIRFVYVIPQNVRESFEYFKLMLWRCQQNIYVLLIPEAISVSVGMLIISCIMSVNLK